jgi:phosphatidylinositol alpha-1,6-mannosyltransferase
VQDGVNGLLVDGTSVEAIAAAMTRLLEDGTLRDRLRVQGLEVAAKAGWGTKTQRFLNLCD